MKRGEYTRMFQTFRKLCTRQSEVEYRRGNLLMIKHNGQKMITRIV